MSVSKKKSFVTLTSGGRLFDPFFGFAHKGLNTQVKNNNFKASLLLTGDSSMAVHRITQPIMTLHQMTLCPITVLKDFASNNIMRFDITSNVIMSNEMMPNEMI